jgi:hypothetical protein
LREVGSYGARTATDVEESEGGGERGEGGEEVLAARLDGAVGVAIEGGLVVACYEGGFLGLG